MSTTLAITSLALSSAALANTPTCGNGQPILMTPELIWVLKAFVLSLLIAPVIGWIRDPEYDRTISAMYALMATAFIWVIGCLVILAIRFLVS